MTRALQVVAGSPALRTCRVPSTENKNPLAGKDRGPQDQYASTAVQRQAQALDQVEGCKRKQLQSLTAKLAIAGFELHPLVGDKLIVARWGMHKVLADVEAAEAILHQVGGVHG